MHLNIMIKQKMSRVESLTSSSGTSSRTSRNLSPEVDDEIGVPCVVDVVVV